jgi:NAD(P)-dependent dehydrogenase (short-subunit alcohol dehydrogenase family)
MSRTPRYISKLLGRRVLILGGTSGLGFAVAEAAIEHGAEVIVSSSSDAKVTKALDRLRNVARPLTKGTAVQDEIQAKGTTCDLADETKLETNLHKLLDFATSGGTRLLDHVVFTAGDVVNFGVTLADVTVEEIAQRQIVRVVAPTILGKLLPSYIAKSSTSSYTLTNGINSYKPPPGLAVYAGQTSALEGLARGLAVELQPVRVNTVMFGIVPTEMHEPWPEDVRNLVFNGYKEKTLVGAVGNVEDAAEPYIYCMKNGFVTGSIVVSDGGRLLV